MERAAHFAQALVRIHGNDLGSHERFAAFQRFVEAVVVQPAGNAQILALPDFRSEREIAAVNKVKSVNFALRFGCGIVRDRHKRIHLRGRNASLALHGKRAVTEPRFFYAAFA